MNILSLTNQIKAVNQSIRGLALKENLLSRIESCFEKSFLICKELEFERNSNIDRFFYELQTLRKYSKILKLETKSEVIKKLTRKIFLLEDLPLEAIQGLFSAQDLNKLLQIYSKSPFYEFLLTHEKLRVVKNLNQGISCKTLGFTLKTLQRFIKTYGAQIDCLNLEGLRNVQPSLFDHLPSLKVLVGLKSQILSIIMHPNLKNLRSLNLSNSMTDDKICAAISEHLKKINSLNISFSSVTHIGIKHIAENLDLIDLDCSDTSIGDESVTLIVERLSHLKTLDITGSQITKDGRETLKSSLQLETFKYS